MTTTTQTQSTIEDLLRRYEGALNQGDAEAAAALYEDDAVFMAQHRTPAVGRTAILAAYQEIFQAIRLNVAFTFDEVVSLSPTVAYARTRSSGETTVLGPNVRVAEANQELFLLGRASVDGAWRIARYIFATTNPMPGATP